MYLRSIHFENAVRNGDGCLTFRRYRGTLRKWTMLPAGPAGKELLQLTALACAGADFLPRMPCRLSRFVRRAGLPLRIELAVFDHRRHAGESPRCILSGSGVELDARGAVRSLRRWECRLMPPDIRVRKLPLGTGNSATHLFLGYGPEVHAHAGTDVYDFSDPFHRVTRLHSLFSPRVRITDPVVFLERLHYRGIMVSRFPARHALECICRTFKRFLAIPTDAWQDRDCSFREEWARLRPWQRRAALPVLDVVRHMVDASPRSGYPLEAAGVMVLDRPDRYSTHRRFPLWISLMDRLFPRLQCVLTVPATARSSIPRAMVERRLELPSPPPPRPRCGIASRARRTTVLLIDVDGTLPNVALMKLARHFRRKGRRVILGRKECRIKGPEHVFASCVFFRPSSRARVERLREFYGQSLTVGGTGVDCRKRLPAAIEDLPADYSLYPELGDRAIGFLTRGCPHRCAYCIVPVKEGTPRQVAEFDDLLQSRYKKLILLDDNILAHPKSAEFLEEMVRRDLQVNFNQTLDIRLLDREKAGLLRRIRSSNVRFTRSVYHFSLNDTRHVDLVRRRYGQLGFGRGDNVEFICMYGYNTTLAEDVERFRFLRSLPGAYVFVQRYQPPIGSAEPDLSGFFDERADALIDALIAILFPQNMKSMETYYRWLSKRYAQAFGRIHVKLVDTIFRYNNRHRKGRYLAGVGKGVRPLFCEAPSGPFRGRKRGQASFLRSTLRAVPGKEA